MTKKIIGLSLLAAMIIIVVSGLVKKSMDEPSALDNIALGSDVDFLATSEGLAAGERAPDFQLTNIDGERVRLSDFHGQKVILNFWTSWCPPCRAEMPHMQNYHEEKAEDANAVILAVNLTDLDHGMAKIEEFIKDYDLTFSIPMDTDGEVGSIYQAAAIPTSYMIDTEGKVQHKIVGPMNEEMMESYVEKLN
ncbi:MAG TPA: redoxin domain-containing protein [Planococcus sp. (in: firmicutes)]|nr:redoxin domain-containing protein [Planococcus sp. (in: firmicutes)]